jgi:pimeloyl-ACP methyl ester carboxylesterase
MRSRVVARLLLGSLVVLGCGKKDGSPTPSTPTPAPPNAAQTVVIIHGIGNQEAGYSLPTQALLELRMGDVGFREVLWSDLGSLAAMSAARESPEFRRAEEEWQAEISREEARISTMISTNLDRGRLQREYAEARRYVGPILQYEFLSRTERGKIQARLREALEAVASSPRTHLVAHSLGSVIAFDVLHGSKGATPPLKVESFYTLGSPLNRRMFKGHNGRPTAPPPGVSKWTNVYSPWDIIGSALSVGYPGVRDRKIETPIYPIAAHTAYWTHTEVIGLFPAGVK